MRFKFDNRLIPVLTAKQFEYELDRLREIAHSNGVEEIEIGIISGIYNGIRYYAIDSDGVDVIEPSIVDWDRFWDSDWDSEIVE